MEYSKDSSIHEISLLIDEGRENLLQEPKLSMKYLQGVCQLQCGLQLALSKLKQRLCCDISPEDDDDELSGIEDKMTEICADPDLNLSGAGNQTGPKWFLLRYVTSQWGADTTQRMADHNSQKRIFPPCQMSLVIIDSYMQSRYNIECN